MSRDRAWPGELRAGKDSTPRSQGYASRTWQRLRHNRLAMVGLIVVAALIVVAVLAPVIAPHDPAAPDYGPAAQYQAPSWSHPMGTDGLGRDWFSRVIYGARVSLVVGIMAQVVVVGVGLPLGLIAGMRERLTGSVIMRVTDLAYAFPELLLLILLRGLIGGSLALLVAIIGLITWMDVTRLVRGQVLSLREREFVTASQAMGATDTHVMLRHLLPNLLGPLVVILALGVPRAIFLEATLSFIGYGVSLGTPSWGAMVRDGYAAFASPHLMLFPAAGIAVLMLSFTFLSDGLRDALDPTSPTATRGQPQTMAPQPADDTPAREGELPKAA